MTKDDVQSESDELEAVAKAMAMWEHHLETATDHWHEGVQRSAEKYRTGLAEGLGVEPEDVPDEAVEHWQQSVMETGPDEFANAVTGEGIDWFAGLYEKATGEEPPPEVKDTARDVTNEALDRAGDDATDEELIDAVHEAVQRRMGGASVES